MTLPSSAQSGLTNSHNSNNNSSQVATFGHTAYSKEEHDLISKRLNMRLGQEYISTRQGPGGTRVHYIEGNKSIELANKIFGFNGWSMSVLEVVLDFLDESAGKFTLGLSVCIRVTLKDGCFREDIGYGTANGMRQKGEAFEKAKKEAVTDGLKRCLRSFGSALGNCLYEKDFMKSGSNYAESSILRPQTFLEPVSKDISGLADSASVIKHSNLVQPIAQDLKPASVTNEVSPRHGTGVKAEQNRTRKVVSPIDRGEFDEYEGFDGTYLIILISSHCVDMDDSCFLLPTNTTPIGRQISRHDPVPLHVNHPSPATTDGNLALLGQKRPAPAALSNEQLYNSGSMTSVRIATNEQVTITKTHSNHNLNSSKSHNFQYPDLNSFMSNRNNNSIDSTSQKTHR